MSFSPLWALFVLLGIALALWMTSIQWRSRGGHKGDLWAITVITVPAAVIGGRLDHLIASPGEYFGPDGDPIRAFALWDGGFGFWGALILGVLAAWALTRFQGVKLLPFLDSVAPGLILGQVAGAWGDWIDQRLTLTTVIAESVWNLIGCILLIVIAKRLRFGHGQVFALYLCFFALGRVWLEALRIGTPAAEDARMVVGLPLNVWSAIVALLIGMIWLVASRARHRTPETGVYLREARTLQRRRRRGKHDFEPVGVAPAASGDTRAGAHTDPVGGSVDGSVSDPSGEGVDENGMHSFGFFGAVTSAISIVPDVRGRSREDGRPPSAD